MIVELVDVLLGVSAGSSVMSQFCNTGLMCYTLIIAPGHISMALKMFCYAYLVHAFVKTAFHQHRCHGRDIGARDRQHRIHNEFEARL